MLTINKTTSNHTIDFAAEELKKYLRMMMPESNEIDIAFNASASDGFRLGLFSDFGIEEKVEDPKLDDVLYAKCDTEGGIIAGNNERSVLLAVYEYLRQNGLRWLYPGIDGEYVPVKSINPVQFMIKPSCRYRGYANASAASYQQNLDFIDFLPKIGMNTFMVQYRVPVYYTDQYYSHKRNEKNRPSEKVTNETIFQWKRGMECEMAKRGLVFHDIGHGFNIDPFGIDSNLSWNKTDEKHIPEESRKYLAEIGGNRGLHFGVPINTNFCMSNKEARKIVAKYVAEYALNHKNADVIHVWLADGCNNHCECEECIKSTPSDLYVELLNDIDEEMVQINIDTKIVFLAYVDTSWAPKYAKLNNPERFIFMLAPFTRLYYESMPKHDCKIKNPEYVRNKIHIPKQLEEYLVFYKDWMNSLEYKCSSFAFEYHFCWNEYYDPSVLKHAKLIIDEIKLYKSLGIDGVLECGDMRGFLPNGFAMYALGRTLLDISVTFEQLVEDYFSHIYGEKWKDFVNVLARFEEIIPYRYLAKVGSENREISQYYAPKIAKEISENLARVLSEARCLVEECYNSSARVQTISVRLFEHYIDLFEGLCKVVSKKCVGNDKAAQEEYDVFETEYGKRETEIERYFNQTFFFNYLHYMVYDDTSKIEFVL